MRIVTSLACLTLVAVAGCKQQPSVKMTNATLDQVANQQAATVKMKPGEWEITAETLDMKMTGAPAGMPPMPQQTKVTTKICLTQDQVDKPTAMFGQGMEQFKKSCVYDNFEMKGGKVNATMHCDLPQGQKVTATTHGTFSDTSMSTESESKVSGMPNGMGVSTKMKMTGNRVGECTSAAKS
jgi:Tfp pilus assembly protein PilX